jgi:hypothetical protein
MSEHLEEASPSLSAMVPVFVIVCLLGAMASCGIMQSRLKKQAAQAIEQAGFEKVDVAFKGKTAVLSGSVDGAAALEELRGLVSELAGVRGVRADALQVDQAPAAEPAEVAAIAHPVEAGEEHVKDTTEVEAPAAEALPDVKPEAPGAGSGKKESSASEGPVPKGIPLAILVEDEEAGEAPPGKKPKPGAGKKTGAKKTGPRKPAAPRAVPAEERVPAIATAMKADAQLRVKVISSSQYPYEASDVVKRARVRLEALKAALVEAGVSEERIELVLRANLLSSSKVARSHVEFHLY